jgi:hypothetical protein
MHLPHRDLPLNAATLWLAMPTLFKSAYATLEHRVASRLVRVARSVQPFASAITAREEVARWADSVSELAVSELGFMLDWRLAPLTTDPEVLRIVVSGTNALGARFARHALLMVSALGELQARRLQRVHESEPEIFTDEDAAYRYVTGG